MRGGVGGKDYAYIYFSLSTSCKRRIYLKLYPFKQLIDLPTQGAVCDSRNPLNSEILGSKSRKVGRGEWGGAAGPHSHRECTPAVFLKRFLK